MNGFGVMNDRATSGLTCVAEAARQRALERFGLLQPHLEQGVALTTVAAEAGLG